MIEIPVCTYSVGDPFNGDEEPYLCGKPAIKVANFPPKPQGFGTIWYCKRHWTVASQVIQPGVEIVDLISPPEAP